MPNLIEPELLLPALKGALEQISHLSLAKLGLDITRLPFWLAIIGFPLAVFEVCTRHIATALNVLMHKAHRNFIHFLSDMAKLALLPVILFGGMLFYGFNQGHITRAVSQVELTTAFFYLILGSSAIFTLLFLASLSRLTGQGNYITGTGFLMGAVSIYIEVVQEYGLIGQISCFSAFVATIGLWAYGRNYNLKRQRQAELEKQAMNPQHQRARYLRNRCLK